MAKVLLLAPSPELAGGIARWTMHILSYYSSHKGDCELEFLNTSQSKYSLNRTGFNRLSSGIRNYLNVIKDFKSRIKIKQYDVIHITTSASLSLLKDLILINIAHKNDIQAIIHFRFGRIPDLSKNNNWEWILLKKVVANCDNAITIDMKSYETLVKYGFKNIINIPNPLSQDIIQAIDLNKNITRQPRLLVFVGQMLRTKGIYELVEVCSTISDIQLHMYGTLPSGVKENIQSLVGYESDKWLHICGEIPYEIIVKKMLEANIFVLPTYTEGFPNVILESMACGCPIIASSVGAIPEMLNIGNNEPCGIGIDPKNKVQLKTAIEYLLNNPIIATELGDRAKRRVVEEYKIDSVWKKMISVWNN
ncbi:MAG: glycosyltransferase [Muribaculaceae bacterium]